jgi:hypothetical protein
MRKTILLLQAFLLSTLYCQAGRPVKITLTDNNTKQAKNVNSSCNIVATREAGSNDGEFDVTIEMENRDDMQLLCLFKRSYTVKDLKKRRPVSVKFDKYFPVDKKNRVIESCKELEGDVFIDPQEKKWLLNISVEKGEPATITLPIYIAKYKNRKRRRLLLEEEDEIELTIKVDAAPVAKYDAAFPRLKESCDSLMEELDRHRNGSRRFCTDYRHEPHYETAEQPFRDKIEEIISEIDNIVNRERLSADSERGQKYQELHDRLTDIDFSQYEYDCGRHGIPPYPPKCNYCKKSLSAIYNDMNLYYQRAGGGIKSNYEKGMKAMYNCCSKHKAHRNEWKKNSQTVKNIKKVYERFCDL